MPVKVGIIPILHRTPHPDLKTTRAVRAVGVPTCDRWLGLIVSGDLGRTRLLVGYNLQTS